MTACLSVALIGAGGIAQDHVAAYARIPGVRVSHIGDTDAARARSLADHAANAAWSTDMQAVFAAPDVDAVDICTPSETHAPLVIAAAKHGKAIHVEKPAALSLADFDAMVAATERHGVSLMVGQTARFQPVNTEIASEIAAGTIGRLRVLHLTWYAGHVWADGWRAWQLDPARSGGHPLHNGIHALDLAIWLFGRTPMCVFTRGFRTFAPTMGIPDSFHMTVRFDDGSFALLEIAYALRQRGDALRRILAIGEAGSLSHSTEDDPHLYSDGVHLPSPTVEDAMYHQLRHWIATLRGEESSIVKNAQVRHALAAALAAQESLETGRAVTVGEARNG
ncbi:MAG: Gfo/Idh/MocA family protein [Thermomicrobiales bacterium]